MPLWHYLSGSMDAEWRLDQSNVLYSVTWKTNELLLESHSLYWIILKVSVAAQETHSPDYVNLQSLCCIGKQFMRILSMKQRTYDVWTKCRISEC